jgi:hypothetical protein
MGDLSVSSEISYNRLRECIEKGNSGRDCCSRGEQPRRCLKYLETARQNAAGYVLRSWP